jgi:redox-sensitive bicupin YhaK (pirin superfamily)
VALPSPVRSVRVVAGEIDSRLVSTRLVLPTSTQPVWPPYRRVSEATASRGRQLPAHAHTGEEVLTYVTEGYAAYQLGDDPAELLPQGSARLLTAPTKASHRVSPAQGGAIRWFNLVVELPATAGPSVRVQSVPASSPMTEIDTVEVRPLIGGSAPMTSAAGVECQELIFTHDSATIPRIGTHRRAVVYALAGRGSVDQQTLVGGEAALIQGLAGVAIHGSLGFRAILATAPGPTDGSTPAR